MVRQQCGRGCGGGGAAVVSAPHVAHDCDRVTACPRVSATRRDTRRQRGAGRSGGHSGDNGPLDSGGGRVLKMNWTTGVWSDAGQIVTSNKLLSA